MHSGQHSTQAQSTGQGGLSVPSSLVCHSLCDPASFPPGGATVSINPEPEDQEPNFATIGLQDITLDDGKSQLLPTSPYLPYLVNVCVYVF